MNIMFFLLSKLLYCIFKLKILRKKFRNIYRWICNNSKCWSLLTMTIEANLMVIVFKTSVQFLAPNYLCFINKVNILLCLLYLFIAFIYTASFYVLVFKYE